jgi:hypothetical protein
MCACHPSKAALYRQHAEKIRAIAQKVPLAETKVLLLKAAMRLEERAEDEERRSQKGIPIEPPAREE